MMISSFFSRSKRQIVPNFTNVFLRKVASRTFSNASSDLNVVLYQYNICPFCHKVKALLDYSRLPYESIEVNPVTKAELKFSSDYKKVPIAIINEEQVNGSDEIVEVLLQKSEFYDILMERWEEEAAREKDITQEDPDSIPMSVYAFDTPQTREWANWANTEVAKVLYPNISKSLSDSYRAFNYVHDVSSFSTFQKMAIQTIGSFAMYMAASRIKKKHDIKDEKRELEYLLSVWVGSGLVHNDFHSKLESPDCADLAVFGVLRSVEGLPIFEEVIKEHGIHEWYKKVKKSVES